MAKKNRTINDLTDNLDKELSWRKKELSILKIKITTDTNEIQKSLIRAGITILYAHWEGFIKNAAESYLNFVSLKRLTYNQLKPCFVALCLRKKLDIINSTSFEKRANAVEFFFNELNKRAYIPYSDVIHTKSNLNSKIFKDICFIIGIDYSKYVLKENLIDLKLLNNRNNIAHGNHLSIDFIEFEEIYKNAIDLIDSFKEDIIDAVKNRQYERI